jgi:hypothetical protein
MHYSKIHDRQAVLLMQQRTKSTIAGQGLLHLAGSAACCFLYSCASNQGQMNRPLTESRILAAGVLQIQNSFCTAARGARLVCGFRELTSDLSRAGPCVLVRGFQCKMVWERLFSLFDCSLCNPAHSALAGHNTSSC